MTRSLCLCRKISKGWVSVQCPDVLVTVTEGRYYLMGGRGRQDSSHAMVPCSRAAFTKLQGMRERQPWLLASLCSWRTSSQRGLLPWGAPRNGARGSVSGTDLAEPPGREASQRQASPLTKYLHISEIIFIQRKRQQPPPTPPLDWLSGVIPNQHQEALNNLCQDQSAFSSSVVMSS